MADLPVDCRLTPLSQLGLGEGCRVSVDCIHLKGNAIEGVLRGNEIEVHTIVATGAPPRRLSALEFVLQAGHTLRTAKDPYKHIKVSELGITLRQRADGTDPKEKVAVQQRLNNKYNGPEMHNFVKFMLVSACLRKFANSLPTLEIRCCKTSMACLQAHPPIGTGDRQKFAYRVCRCHTIMFLQWPRSMNSPSDVHLGITCRIDEIDPNDFQGLELPKAPSHLRSSSKEAIDYVAAVNSHIMNGSKKGHVTRFLSATRCLRNALSWGYAGGHHIVKIDLAKASEEQIVVLDVGDVHSDLCYGGSARNFAVRSREVVLDNSIPAHCCEVLKVKLLHKAATYNWLDVAVNFPL